MNFENVETAKIIKWSRENAMGWEAICGDGMINFCVSEIIVIMENLMSMEFYQLVVVMLKKLEIDRDMHEAISNAIANNIARPEVSNGILSDCIQEIKQLAMEKNIMKNKIVS